MRKILAFICTLVIMLLSFALPNALAAESFAAPGADSETQRSEEQRTFASDKPFPGWSYSNQYGFTELPCQPSHFKERVETAMKEADEQDRTAQLQSVLSSYGFVAEEGSELYPSGMTIVELHGYGDVPSQGGGARITLIKLYGNGTSLYFVFLRKAGDWYLTDSLVMDYWEADSSYPYPEMMLHWGGKPGAWLVTRRVGHGTGVYVDSRQWYNVFTRKFDLSYTLEGFDSTMDEANWYHAGWITELGFTPDEVGDTLRFITYEGMVKNPFDNPDFMGEEIYSAMTLHEYRYDPQSASYVSVQAEKQTAINPGSIYASGYLRER